jgi:2-dehydro-3-deoxygluconokinase
MSLLQNSQIRPGSVLSFGELLIRISPDADGKWLDNNSLPFYIGGAELNVASALALWGVPTRYFTALPDNGLSDQVVKYLQKWHIDTSAIHFGGDRIGIYYLTQGQDLKNSGVIYDRANSSFATLQTGIIDWDKVLDGVSWFHFSAICPAIGQNVADVCLEAITAATQKNITVSVDLNYRSKLWKYGKTPLEIMPQLVQHCDLVMGNLWAAEMMLGIDVIADIHQTGEKKVYLREALKSSQAIMKQFDNCKAVANTFRFDATNDVTYYTTLYTDGQLHHSAEYETNGVADKSGSGDCFMAGLIYGFQNSMSAAETLKFATAAAFGKLFVKGDATSQTVAEIRKAYQ